MELLREAWQGLVEWVAGGGLLMTAIAAAPFGLFLWRFLHRWWGERRSLWLGVTFLGTIVFGTLFVTYLAIALPGFQPLMLVAVVLCVLLVLLLLAAPVMFVVLLFGSGIRLVRREGFRPTNALSLGLGVVIVAYVFVWPSVRRALPSMPALDWLFGVAAFAVEFTSILFVLYLVTSWLNQRPRRGVRYDHVVVLGAGLMPDGSLTPLLAGRVSKGMECCSQSPGCVLVTSGGQGPDEVRSEGSAMREYAIENGLPASDVIAEEASTTTRENLLLSWRLMGDDPGRVLVVSDDYHVYRALLIAKHLGLACDGRGARVRLYFSLNAFVREFVAFLVIWKRPYAVTIAVFGALQLAIALLRVVLAA